MPVIYMKHPKHGEKVAVLEAEAKADEARGWTRFNPMAPVVPSPDPIAVQLAPVVASITEAKKRGRPRKVV